MKPPEVYEPSANCIASLRRKEWALNLSGLPKRAWPRLCGCGRLPTMGWARYLCEKAGVPLAALYLPDPSWHEMTRARIIGHFRRRRWEKEAACEKAEFNRRQAS